MYKQIVILESVFSIIGLSLSTTTENSFGRPCIPVMRHQGNHKNEHFLLQEKISYNGIQHLESQNPEHGPYVPDS